MPDIAINLSGVIGWMTWVACAGFSFLIALYFALRRSRYTNAMKRVIYFSSLCILSLLFLNLPFILSKQLAMPKTLIWADYGSPFIALLLLALGLIYKPKNREVNP